ncbi:hypothetical protein NC653_034214 [Populus alba x Populus x berolinensis]|uniref:Uncharacterized protein n=1 Tax=Populus alba x Populus x berolinensis TaxID=444605 RepID=A0AAD6PVZ3_9ROSI|nr:hypothetical protein NC653_034214 [Populus alba x Populus x berolinensis]
MSLKEDVRAPICLLTASAIAVSLRDITWNFLHSSSLNHHNEYISNLSVNKNKNLIVISAIYAIFF